MLTTDSPVPTTGVISNLQKAQERIHQLQQQPQQPQQQQQPQEQQNEENESEEQNQETDISIDEFINNYKPIFISKISFADQINFDYEGFFKNVFVRFANDINDINEVRIAKNYLDKVAEIDNYEIRIFICVLRQNTKNELFLFLIIVLVRIEIFFTIIIKKILKICLLIVFLKQIYK